MVSDVSSIEPGPGPVLRVAGRRLDPATGELTGPDAAARLEPKVLEVLLLLASRPGELVSKAELLQTVWPETAVSDDVVWRCIAALRRAFDDDPRSPEVIETLSRRGYRLIAEVSSEPLAILADAVPVAFSAPGQSFRRERRRGPTRALAVVALLLLVAATAWSAWRSATTTSRSGPGADVAASTPVVLPGSTESWEAADLVRLGREYYERRSATDVQRAIQIFQQAIEIDPLYAPAWAGLGDAQAQLTLRFDGGLERAEAGLRAADRALVMDPDLPEAYKARGLALGVLGRMDEAMEAYGRALELRPGFTPAVTNLATILGGRGQYDRALELYVTLESPGLDRAVDLHNIGDALYHAGLFEEARGYLEYALRIDPLQADSIITLSRIDVIEGDPEAARRRVQRAIAVQSESRELRLFAGELSAIGGDLERARRELWSGLYDAPRDRYLESHVLLVWVDQQLGGEVPLRGLIDAYAEAVPAAVDERRVWHLAQLAAAIAVVRGDEDEAIEWLARALELGHLDQAWLRHAPMLGGVRHRPDFERLLQSARQQWVAREAALRNLLVHRPPG